MKKYVLLLMGALIFILCPSSVFAVKEVYKDFHETDQYYFEVGKGSEETYEIARQCVYKLIDGEDDSDESMYLVMRKQKAGSDYRFQTGFETSYGEAKNSFDPFGGFSAIDYYSEKKRCPEYIVYDIAHGDYYLSDDIHLDSIEEYIINNTYGSSENIQTYKIKSETVNSTFKYKDSDDNGDDQTDSISEFPEADSCADFSDASNYFSGNGNSISQRKKYCEIGRTASGNNFGCVWNDEYNFCSPSGLAYLLCGSGKTKAYDIPVIAPRLTSYVITALKTITPVVLIIIGMFQLIKSIASQNEDEMKKAKSALIKKLIAACMVFFIVAIVQFIVKQTADDSEIASTESCFDCFINNKCGKNVYYTDGYGNCFSVSNNKKIDCPVDNY